MKPSFSKCRSSAGCNPRERTSAHACNLLETRVATRCSSTTFWMLLHPAVCVNPLFLARFRAGDRRRFRDLLLESNRFREKSQPLFCWFTGRAVIHRGRYSPVLGILSPHPDPCQSPFLRRVSTVSRGLSPASRDFPVSLWWRSPGIPDGSLRGLCPSVGRPFFW